MDEDGVITFLGVPAPVLVALGKITVASGRLENAAIQVAASLTLDAGTKTLARTIELIRTALAVGTPSWATASTEEVEAWCRRALNIADRRNRELHAVRTHIATEGGWESMAVDPRDRRRRSDEPKKLTQLAVEIAKAAHEDDLLRRLLVPLREGVGMFPLGSPLAGSPVVFQLGDDYPARPQPAALDALWQAFYPAMAGYHAGVTARGSRKSM